MKRNLFCCSIALAATFMFLAPNAGATPSNQILIPSTDTQPVVDGMPTVHLGIDNRTTLAKKKENGGHDLPTQFGLTVGFVDSRYVGFEAGLDMREPTDYPFSYNAKVQLKEDSIYIYSPAISLGFYDMGTQNDENDYNIFYLMMAKTLPVLGRLSVGYYVGNDQMLYDANGMEDNDGLMVSWDRTLAEIDDRLWLAVEYMEGENLYGALSFGLSWRFAPGVNVLVGYNSYNEVRTAGENTYTFQFDLDI